MALTDDQKAVVQMAARLAVTERKRRAPGENPIVDAGAAALAGLVASKVNPRAASVLASVLEVVEGVKSKKEPQEGRVVDVEWRKL